MTDTTTTLADTLAPLASRLAQVLEDKAALEAEERDVKARIRDLVPSPDLYAAGGYNLSIQHNRRFDAKRALPLIPEALLPVVTYPETTIDKDRLKALLPDLYEACQAEGDWRVGFAR